MTPVQVCVVQGTSLTTVSGMVSSMSNDTTVNGQPFATAYPATVGYAAGSSWFINNDAVTFMGKRYVKYGLPRVLSTGDVRSGGEYQGVGVFMETSATGTPDVIYVPTRPGCEFQPYQQEQAVRTVRG